ncbi:MAG: carbonate dehydratase [Candidatus Parcubacteria bacterium]|nr:carbonate dehydratase [Burkholderiales bacterium]
MTEVAELFARNRAWARSMQAADPDFFSSLANQQSPEFLWIGCSDSRVPANQITGLAPGEVFVHRNVANLVVHTDLNCLSVLQFAVDQLRVRHVIVCGHYGCSGVHAALHGLKVGLADNWLRHVQDVSENHAAELGAIAEPAARERRLCELNVMEQVRHVCDATVVQDAWAGGRPLSVHGWIYGVENGLLRDLECTRTGASP